jgi:hypothetical protein
MVNGHSFSSSQTRQSVFALCHLTNSIRFISHALSAFGKVLVALSFGKLASCTLSPESMSSWDFLSSSFTFADQFFALRKQRSNSEGAGGFCIGGVVAGVNCGYSPPQP